jgi:hypothetical protein
MGFVLRGRNTREFHHFIVVVVVQQLVSNNMI